METVEKIKYTIVLKKNFLQSHYIYRYLLRSISKYNIFWKLLYLKLLKTSIYIKIYFKKNKNKSKKQTYNSFFKVNFYKIIVNLKK